MEENIIKDESEINTPSAKKYIRDWRNKWITAKASSIDDFIDTYKGLAELMKSWKSKGIKLDPDIFGGVGDDYARFCTYDEAVAIEEGFEEDYYEEEESDDFQDWEEPTLEFQINEYITIKLIDDSTQIYVSGERFEQCRYLLIINPQKNQQQHEIESIDEAELLYQRDLEERITPEQLGITKQQEFWAHCSNLQAWAENNYNSRLLHRNLAFPLLKKLVEVGDQKANRAFKDEIAQRFVKGYLPVIRFLFFEKYVDFLTPEEFSTLLDELNYSKINLTLLLRGIHDYTVSKYGKDFLLRIKEEFNEFISSNHIYVEVKTHKLDKSMFSPIVITPDSKYFIRGSGDGKLKMFKIVTGELIRVFGDHDNAVFHIALSPRGRYIASSSDKDIKIWNFKTGGLITTFKGHRDDVTTLIFAPDSDNYLVSGSGSWELNECAIKIWDLDARKLLGTESSHWEELSSLAFSRDGDILLSGAFDKTINVWDIENGKLLKTLIGSKSAVIDVAITNNKEKIISASLNNIITVWDLNSGGKIREIIIEEEDFNLDSLVLTPDSKFIVAGLQGGHLKDGGLLKVWRISDGEVIQTLPIKQNFSGYYEELNNIAISNDGRFIISASRERMVKVWICFSHYLLDFCSSD